MLIVAVGHRKRMGKETFCKFVSTHLRLNSRGKNIKIASFADKLKDVCYTMYGWTGLQPGNFYKQPENEYLKEIPLPLLKPQGVPISPRQLWIDVGTNVIRKHYDETVWLNSLLKTKCCDLLLIEDLRFPVEVSALKNEDSIIIRLTDPRKEYTDDDADRPLLDYGKWWDHDYLNQGSLNDLNLLAVNFAQKYILNREEWK